MSEATMTTGQALLVSTTEVLTLTTWDRGTLERMMGDDKFPRPLFNRGRKRWWSRRAVLRALGIDQE